MKILLLEDERKVRDFIVQALEQEGMTVDALSDLSELKLALQNDAYEVLILDRLLEGQDSLQELLAIKQSYPQLQVLVLSALSEIEEKLKGFDQGADDYLGKPFHVAELIARVRALARRAGVWERGGKDTLLIYKNLKIDLETQKAFHQDKIIELTGKELRILCLLLKSPGKIFSKSKILDQVWGLNHFPESNVVEVTIAKLRSKLDSCGEEFIHSRRGVGYWLGEVSA